MATANDVAAYILNRIGRPITTMKLQKLCYYSQGWSLAWDEKPLFRESIQAWANGPVIYEVFDNHRGKFTVSDWTWGDPKALTPDEAETVDAVVAHYGDFTGQQLSDMTHGEPPWLRARGTTPLGQSSSEPLSLDLMQEYFSDLATAQ